MKNRKYEPIEVEKKEVVAESAEIMPEPVEEVAVFEEKKGIVVNCTSLYVRMQPHSNGTPVSTIDAGTSVDVIEESNDFWNVRLSDGTEGFCMKKFIKIV